MYIREFEDEDGTAWQAFGDEAIVAHGRRGAILTFRPPNVIAETVRSTVTFNSSAAAELALRPMSVKELRRRLSLARMATAGA